MGRRELAEPSENVRPAHIARVDDQVGSAEGLDGLGP
jgi:hypothetical protein